MPTGHEEASVDEEDRLIDKIGKMVEDNEKPTDIEADDTADERQYEQYDGPRNPKKRMMEGERDVVHNEL